MVELRRGSEILDADKPYVQDPYSFRCIPQVHGASRDVIGFFRQTVEREIGSVTDNPTVFHEQDQILSGGNFHGQPLALGLDMLANARSGTWVVSAERRTYKLISGTRGLPAFLVADPGLEQWIHDPAIHSSVNGQLQQTTLYSGIGGYH